jgi:hypothetical protein
LPCLFQFAIVALASHSGSLLSTFLVKNILGRFCLARSASPSGSAALAYLQKFKGAIRFGEKGVLADLRMMSVFRHFERDELVNAVKDHKEAERLYAEADGNLQSRAANLLRLAITLRQRDEVHASRKLIHDAHAMSTGTDRDLMIRLALNAGAPYMDDDLIRVRRYWHSALQMAKRESTRQLYVHALIDVGYLELLLGRKDNAAIYLAEGYMLADELGLDNSLLRGALDLRLSGHGSRRS